MSILLPNKFLSDPDWHLVGESVQEALESASVVPNEHTPPEDYKAQVLAMIKIKKAMETFLVQASIIQQTEDEKNPFV